jgi:hypothetical protein
MIEIKQSTATLALVFYMVDSTDHVTPKTGLAPIVTLSKNGAAFAAPAGAVSEISGGFYRVAGNATDSSSLGILALKATGTAADPVAMAFAVVANIAADTFARLGAPVGASISADVAGVPSATRTNLATELGRMDAAISSSNSTAPDNASIAAIKAKTDNLPVAPASTSDIPTIPQIIGAAGGLNVATVAALEASSQILLAAPYVPTAAPVIVIDAPVAPEMVTVYLDTQEIIGEENATLKIEVSLVESLPAITSTGQFLIGQKWPMVHQSAAPGQYRIDLPRGYSFRATCSKLFAANPVGRQFDTPATGASLNLKDA